MLSQGRFAGTVMANNSNEFPFIYPEAYSIQSGGLSLSRVLEGNIFYLNQPSHHFPRCSSCFGPKPAKQEVRKNGHLP
jgi:hypothetical protein